MFTKLVGISGDLADGGIHEAAREEPAGRIPGLAVITATEGRVVKVDYAKKEAKDDATRYKFLADPTLAAYRKTRGQLPRQALKVQYSAQILDNGNWSVQDVLVNPLSTR